MTDTSSFFTNVHLFGEQVGEIYSRVCTQRDTWKKRSLNGAHELANALKKIEELEQQIQESSMRGNQVTRKRKKPDRCDKK